MEDKKQITITAQDVDGIETLTVKAEGLNVIELLGYLQLAANSTLNNMKQRHGEIKTED